LVASIEVGVEVEVEVGVEVGVEVEVEVGVEVVVVVVVGVEVVVVVVIKVKGRWRRSMKLREKIIGKLDRFLTEFETKDGTWKTHEKYADSIISLVLSEIEKVKPKEKDTVKVKETITMFNNMAYNKGVSDYSEAIKEVKV
jgi:hypothetical protein